MFCPQFWGRKWLLQFYGRLECFGSLCRKISMPIKFLAFFGGRGGSCFGFVGGGVPILLYGRVDFSEKKQPEVFKTEVLSWTSMRDVHATMPGIPGFGGPEGSFWPNAYRDIWPKAILFRLMFCSWTFRATWPPEESYLECFRDPWPRYMRKSMSYIINTLFLQIGFLWVHFFLGMDRIYSREMPFKASWMALWASRMGCWGPLRLGA